jgi:hypothetical protein
MSYRLTIAAAAALLSLPASIGAQPVAPAAGPVMLAPTGQVRDGLPVFTRDTGAADTAAALRRGFSGRLLRLYAMQQAWLARETGRPPEPAYLLLSDRQGGFPRFGFYLDGECKAGVGYVELHRRSTVSGRFGAMDQIFPHELLHVIARQLAGEPRDSGGNQVHAVGVRTDPVNAFGEGFAEHAQIMAVDDEDALPETMRLRSDREALDGAERACAQYARDLSSRWPLARPAQVQFPLWFSRSEQALRYHAVRANRFARQAVVPAALLARDDKYDAYLVQSVMPGDPAGPPKPAAVMLSTEGVVAHLVWRLVTDDAICGRYMTDAMYARFGVAGADVTPRENVYLKLFVVFAGVKPSTLADLLRGWVQVFPEDAADVARVTRNALLGQDLPGAPEHWLASPALQTGTSLFDQYRALPRTHTFDVNAATRLDWLSVPGVTAADADRLLSGAPYATLDEVTALPGLPPALRAGIPALSSEMAALRERAAREEESLSLSAVFSPYIWRLVGTLLLATAFATGLARLAGARRRWTATLVALAASTLVIALAWIVSSPPWYPVAAPLAVGGLPWALWRLARRRPASQVGQAMAVWAVAAFPALLLSRAWF